MTEPQADEAPRKASLRHRLYHGETAIDFVGHRNTWFIVSALVILAGLVSLLAQGLNYGIDFKGGTSWDVTAPGVSVSQARDALRPLGLGEAKIQTASGDHLLVSAKNQNPEQQAKITDKMAELGKVDPAAVSVNDVGPSWGKAVTKKARNALIAFFILISAYISLRFEWKMAVAALLAVVHDILVTVGVYSISRFEVTPATVVAFLTILGYSMYDTIVVFDKVQENTKGNVSTSGRMTYSDTVNLSMNQVLMRSVNTSIVAIMPIVSILVIGAGILGATTLNDFGLALLVGLLTGAYSSIFVASPILAILKEREPRYAGVRQRLAAKGGTGGVLTPAAAAALAGSGGGGGATAPRPRQGTKSPSRAGAKVVPADDEGDDDLLVPARPGASGPNGNPARSKPAPRPGAPRPRKKGKKR